MSHGSVSAATGGRSSNGRTPDSGSGYPGSNPGLPAKSFQQLSLTFFPHGNICGNNLGAAVGGSFRKERRPPDRLGLSGAVFQTRTDSSSGTKGRMSRTSGDWRRTEFCCGGMNLSFLRASTTGRHSMNMLTGPVSKNDWTVASKEDRWVGQAPSLPERAGPANQSPIFITQFVSPESMTKGHALMV